MPKSAQAVGITRAAGIYIGSRCGKLGMRSFHIPAQLTGILWGYFDIAHSCALSECSFSFSGQRQSLLHRQRTLDQDFTLNFFLPSSYISLFLLFKILYELKNSCELFPFGEKTDLCLNEETVRSETSKQILVLSLFWFVTFLLFCLFVVVLFVCS